MKNKKLMISLFSLCLVAIVGLLTTVIVLAAGTQNVNTTINVTYSATNIAGTVSAKSKIANQDAVDMTTDGSASGEKTITFAAEEANANGTLNPQGSLALTAENKYIEFIYTFTSTGDSYKASVAATGFDKKNYSIQYKVGDGEYTDTAATNVDVTSAASSTVTIKIEIVNTAIAVNATGSFAWTLAK